MREIKFRARLLKNEGDKAKGEWVYGLPQQLVKVRGVVNLNKPAEIGYIVSYEPERMLQSHAPDDSLYWYEIDVQTLGQFIGMPDKNGKEIYEDDIIIADWHWAKPHQFVWPDDYYWIQEVSLESDNLKIIGNIYENAELSGKVE